MGSLRRQGGGQVESSYTLTFHPYRVTKRFTSTCSGNPHVGVPQSPSGNNSFLIMLPPSRWQPSPSDGLEHKPDHPTVGSSGNRSSVVCLLRNKIQTSKGHNTAITF